MINLNIIIISICWIATLVAIILLLLKKVFPMIDKNLSIKDKETKNKKYEIFLNASPEKAKESLDKFFDEYINRYIVYKFISNKQDYIKKEDTETMIKDLTKAIYIEIPELYVFYINLTYNIENDDSLLTYIHSVVMDKSIEAVTAFNGTIQ